MFRSKWLFPLLIGAVIALSFIGNHLHNIVWFIPPWIDSETDPGWFAHDTGREFQNTAGWLLLAILLPLVHERRLRTTYPIKITLCYLAQIMAVYALLDLADQIISDNRRQIFSDLIGLSVAIGYGALSAVIYKLRMSSGHEFTPGAYFRVVKVEKSLIMIIPRLLREKFRKEFYTGKVIWVYRKDQLIGIRNQKPGRDCILIYSGSGSDLIQKGSAD